MANEKRLIMTEQDAIVAAEQELNVCRYIAECTRNPGMLAIHRKRCEWLSVIIRLAKKAIKGNAVEVVHGRWEFVPSEKYGRHYTDAICTACKAVLDTHCDNDLEYRQEKIKKKLLYCPNCGAKMDGGNDDG